MLIHHLRESLSNDYWATIDKARNEPEYVELAESRVGGGAVALRHRVDGLDVLDGLAVDGEGALGVQLQLEDAAREHEAEHRLQVQHHAR